MSEHWITVKVASECLNLSERTVQFKAQNNEYEHKYVKGKGKGGKQLRILLESLPQEAQDKYNGVKATKSATTFNINQLTEAQRQKLNEKVFVVNEYESFKKHYLKRDYRKAFLNWFCSEYPEIDVNDSKLEDWTRKYKKGGVENLVDNRGCYGKGTTSLSKEMQQDFLSLYLTDKEPPITTCYNVLKIYYSDKNIKIPSISSFKRFLATIPPSTIALYRKGKKYFEDNFIASIPTVYESNLYSNDEWVADHHIYDVMVNGDGKIGRAWLSVWFDRHSRAIVGYVINLCEPNADIVLDSFYEAAKKCGLPKRVHIDNGKDYKVHDLFNTDNPNSLVSVLEIAVRHAIPYNAKAKPVERVFKTLEDLNKLLDSYIGNSPDNRPESMKGTNQSIANKCMSFESFKKWADACILQYNNTPHTGRGMNGKTPKEVYETGFNGAVRVLPDDLLNILMRRTTKCVKVTKNGVKFRELKDVMYNSLELQELAYGKRVYARYRTGDARIIDIYSEDGVFICPVKVYGEYNFNDSEELKVQTIREYGHHNKKVKKSARKYKSQKTIDVQKLITTHSDKLNDIDLSAIPKRFELDFERQQELEKVSEAENQLKNKEKSNSKVIDETELLLSLGQAK